MTTYYVSSAGSDSNNGLGPDASHASNKPFLTLGKTIGGSGVAVPGDAVWVGPGIIFEGGAIACAAGVSSSGSPTTVRGDPTNAQGFKDSGAVRLTPGACYITTRTSGDTTDGPITSTASMLTPVTGCHGLQFYNLVFEAKTTIAGPSLVSLFWAGNTDWLFEGCRFLHPSVFRWAQSDAPTAGRNFTVRRCFIISDQVVAMSASVSAATADADLVVVFENNLIFGAVTSASNINCGTLGGNLAGGVIFRGNTFVKANVGGTTSRVIQSQASRVSTVTPIRLSGNLSLAGTVSAGTAGQIVDDGYNRFSEGTHNNFTEAGTSKTGFLHDLIFPDLITWGVEMPRIDLFGWADTASTNFRESGWTNTSADMRGRTVRPWGGGAAIGCWDNPSATKDTTSAITGGGTNSLKITGAGEVSLYLPVVAVSTTISVKTKSTSYGGTNYPQLIVMPNPTVLSTQQTATATDATEQTVSVGPFTPTADGVLEVRLVSRSTSTSSATYFDVLAY